MEIFESTVTTNILLVHYITWYLFGKKVIDAYSSRKGHNQAEKEDIGQIESLKSTSRQSFDVELYFLTEFEENVNLYLKSFEAVNESINSSNTDSALVDQRNVLATKLLDCIDNHLEKTFKINPIELPYNNSMQPADNASAD